MEQWGQKYESFAEFAARHGGEPFESFFDATCA